ncbi:MAG: EFR1 family ferrodoxin [Thermodesulfobacteriota bacterium]|nr:EFR1 family ferrodoxin [Thermodesulfobacteriota bacterium]
MSTTIFYYTGTGNSLWVARRIADELGDTELLSISACKDEQTTVSSNIVGLVFPVHIWGLPTSVVRFVNTLKSSQPDYVFAVAVNAGQVSNTLVQLKKLMSKNHLNLSSGFEITTPSNYIPWGGPGPVEKQLRHFELAREKISRIAVRVKEKSNMPVEKGPLWQRILFTAIYKISFPYVPRMDSKFRADDKCNACGICCRVCPTENITMREGKPVWDHQCEQCFACLQWCPHEAIQYGKRTHRYERYHHPEISLENMLKEKSF